MKNSEQLDDLITRHFCNELNSDDQALLFQWLSASEENRQYYEELKNTWQLMKQAKTPEEINAAEEWAYFQECLHQDARGERDDAAAASGKSGIVRKLVIVTTIAASVLFIVAIGYNRFGKTPGRAPAVANLPEDSTPTVIVRHETNTTDKAKQIVLADSSVIILEPLSDLSWHEPFTNNRREITLKGKARFRVAKDPTRPFTVISGQLATTALGTEFTVTAFAEEDVISVQLFEGRVVVKAANSLQPVLKKDYYLLPGEELLYSNKQYSAMVRKFIHHNTTAKNKPEETHNAADQPLLPAGDKGSWYMFNNQPLAQVFKQLQEIYGVKILYAEKDLEKLYFIGKFSKTDSLDTILKQIAALNNLTVTKQNNTYTIDNRQ
ncbi:FecR domain-containing protein [Longitalea arenae]|uniref:FecR domain-containing protein n=1 Tax=Longitalea arenae TaxID=2812558 RepID=UPI001967966B|nr:FecR domain-containing protein [Longitalea arenae]